MRTILLLHGAIGAQDQLASLATALGQTFTVHTLNFSGHGGAAMPGKPFSIALFAAEVLSFLDAHQMETVSVFGYSMGGYVAMYLAKHHPRRVNRIVTLATKFLWTEEIAAREVKMLDAEKIKLKLPAFADSLEKRHAPNRWEDVLNKTAEMMLHMGTHNVLTNEDYPEIKTSALLLLGDRDKMVTIDETLTAYRAMPNAEMGILPGTGHPIEQADPAMVTFFINRFIADED